MTSPKPRRRVRGSATGRPIMALLDLLGRRMTLRILWELREKPLTFRALQEVAATNPSVLNARLKELREARLVEHTAEGYALSPQGRELLATFLPLHAWAEKWAKAVAGRSGQAKR
jgi:DNA-binding HxlR family transcriptional regulator